MNRVSVVVRASDPVSAAGVASCLRPDPGLVLLPAGEHASADVMVVSVDRLTPDITSELRRFAVTTDKPVVLLTGEISDAELLTAVECRVVAVLPRAAVNNERLIRSVRAAAAGGGVLPSDLLGQLLKHVHRMQQDVLQPKGLGTSGLTPREVEVLRLVAEGFDTTEIAGRLCYSDRTVKNVVSGLTTRLNLRNRSHAVAYAVRAGMI